MEDSVVFMENLMLIMFYGMTCTAMGGFIIWGISEMILSIKKSWRENK